VVKRSLQGQAFAAATHFKALIRQTRINDFGVFGITKRTVHNNKVKEQKEKLNAPFTL